MANIYEIEYGCINIKGGVRTSNQDNFYVRKRYRFGSEKLNDITLFGTFRSNENSVVSVYDGMGGEACGDMASLIAAGGTAEFDNRPGDSEQIVKALCLKLNELVNEYAQRNNVPSMGSTAAVIRFSANDICCGNLGDSRIYRINERITQISEDHTVKNYFRKKAPLTQYLGFMSDEIVLEPHIAHEDYTPGNAYLICSDGITDMLTDDVIFSIVSTAPSVKEAVSELVSAALKNGGIDNITAILCKIKEI